MSIITIYNNEEKTEYFFTPGEKLLTLLRERGFAPDAPCGGRGLCGKCKVLLDRGSGKESVLACAVVPDGDCTVWLTDRREDLSWNDTAGDTSVQTGRRGFGAAVDLGTTTVAVSLLDLSSGKRLGSASRWNVQRSCGADVITRVSYCMEHPDGLFELRDAIRGEIGEMIGELCAENGLALADVREIFLAGNTVMQHIFAGIPADSIAAAPYTPASFFDDGKPLLLGEIPVFLSPCVAGYVGGDITAGLLGAGLNEKAGKALFIDVGTNGEMALGGTDGFLSCAVASGPAFEGAGISCGMPAGKGAVNKVWLADGGLSYEVIGGGEAKGLCGSGLLDLAACLLELGYIDESGCLEKNENGEAAFYLTEKVFIDQRDVRQLQLAKAAVAAGIRILLQSAELGFDALDALYLAGGFGNRLRPESAVKIGMLPEEMLGRIKTAGNTSLAGAERALLVSEARAALREIKDKCGYIELSSHKGFNDCFVDEMFFPEVES